MTLRNIWIGMLVLACSSFAFAQVNEGVDPAGANKALDAQVSLGGRVRLPDLLKLMEDHRIAYLVPDVEAMPDMFVMISATDVPLRDVMNAFAVVYDFTWLQQGSIYVLKTAPAMHPGGMPPGFPEPDVPMPTLAPMPDPMTASGVVTREPGRFEITVPLPPDDIVIAMPPAQRKDMAGATSRGNALGETLTQAQWAILKSRGFLKTSDLSTRQRRLIDVRRGGWVQFQYNGKKVVVRGNV